MTEAPSLHLTVGLPGVGKTTLARRLARECRAVRFSPDDWMIPLFGEPEANGKRDVLEGRLLWTAHEVLGIGGSVILDFGCWTEAERWAVRAVTEHAGGRFHLHFLDLPEPERRARATARWEAEPGSTFEMSAGDHERFLNRFQAPPKQRSPPSTCLNRLRATRRGSPGPPTVGPAFPTSVTQRAAARRRSADPAVPAPATRWVTPAESLRKDRHMWPLLESKQKGSVAELGVGHDPIDAEFWRRSPARRPGGPSS